MSKSQRDSPVRAEHTWKSRIFRALIVSPAPLLAATSLVGIGLMRDLSGSLAILCASALAILPVLGLVSLFPKSPWILPLTAWLWGLALLASIPLYFPGQQQQATVLGVKKLTLFMGEDVSRTMSDTGGEMANWIGSLGADSDPPVLGSLDLVEQVSPKPPGQTVPTASELNRTTPSQRHEPILLSYEGDDRSLRIDVGVDGPEIGERYEMILDTGATFSTLSTDALENIGLSVPADAPWVQLQTAAGPTDAPLVLLDAVWLGDFPVEWVTIAVCEECSNPPVFGLLGLNVLQRFRVAIDHDHQRIELHRRERDFDRQLDIAHWLEVESQVTQTWMGNVELVLRSHNRARQAVRTAVIDLDCSGEGFAIQLDYIPAGGDASTRVELPRGTDCQEHTLRLSRADWVEDRFRSP